MDQSTVFCANKIIPCLKSSNKGNKKNRNILQYQMKIYIGLSTRSRLGTPTYLKIKKKINIR